MLTPSQITLFESLANQAIYTPVARPSTNTVAFESGSDLATKRMNVNANKTGKVETSLLRVRFPVVRNIDGVDTLMGYNFCSVSVELLPIATEAEALLIVDTTREAMDDVNIRDVFKTSNAFV